jgi:molecular chaperone DnaK
VRGGPFCKTDERTTMSQVIGIDLGTTNSAVAIYKNGKAEVISNSEGSKLTPSVVFFRQNDTPLVGELAKRQAVTNPERTIRSVKRLMGRRLSEINDLAERLPYEVKSNSESEEVYIRLDNRDITPQEISSLILQKMRRTACDFLGGEVTQAIITVPAYFNDAQRQSTKQAAREAGLEPLRIINEPTAAALAYGISSGVSQKVAVFDFGGGTFDISILDLEEDIFEVLSTNGDTQLGGDNIDEILTKWLVEQIRIQTEVDPSGDMTAMQRIIEAAERAKCELSSLMTTIVSLPFIVADSSGAKHFSCEISRETFEGMIQPILEALKTPCRKAINDANLTPEEIQTIVLVGGSTRIPAVQAVVRDIFGQDPIKTLNPDEAVALGAAIQGGILSGDIAEVVLLDVTPLSLGIELEGGVFRVLIPRNSSIPVSVSKRFTTAKDNQTSVNVHVLQGERSICSENRSLAHLRLKGISLAPAEVPEIEVTFSIDADGILSVAAMDMTSGANTQIVVESFASAAATSEITRAIEDAEVNVNADRDFVELAQIKQRASSLVRTMEEFLNKKSEDLSESSVASIREALFRLEVCIHANDPIGLAEAEAILMEEASRHSEKFFVQKFTDRPM